MFVDNHGSYVIPDQLYWDSQCEVWYFPYGPFRFKVRSEWINKAIVIPWNHLRYQLQNEWQWDECGYVELRSTTAFYFHVRNVEYVVCGYSFARDALDDISESLWNDTVSSKRTLLQWIGYEWIDQLTPVYRLRLFGHAYYLDSEWKATIPPCAGCGRKTDRYEKQISRQTIRKVNEEHPKLRATIEHSMPRECGTLKLPSIFVCGQCDHKPQLLLEALLIKEANKWRKRTKQLAKQRRQCDELKKLLRRTQTAMTEGNLEALKLLKREFKRAANLHP